MAQNFLVIYDDKDGLCIPARWDPDCEGALDFFVPDGSAVAVFEDRPAARRAMKVSRLHNLLLKAQGRIANDDWIDPESRKNVRIVPLEGRAS